VHSAYSQPRNRPNNGKISSSSLNKAELFYHERGGQLNVILWPIHLQ
jgi:hypothetical protein